MPSGKSDWFNSLLLKLDQEKLSSISVKRKKIIFEIESKDRKLSLKNNPDLKIDEEKLKQVAEVIDAFYFYDVRKVNKIKNNIFKSILSRAFCFTFVNHGIEVIIFNFSSNFCNRLIPINFVSHTITLNCEINFI